MRAREPAAWPAITEENLHFGTHLDDPNGMNDCSACAGHGVVDGAPCPPCHERQQLRNAWWNSSTGPTRQRRMLRNL